MLGKLLGLIFFFCASLCSGSMLGVEGLSLKVGMGYEFLSQDFYLDSLEQAGADSLDVTTSLKTTYMDDLKGQIRFGYAPSAKPALHFDGIFEQTSDQSRLRGYINHGFAAGPFRLDWNAEADWRNGKVDPELGDPGYISGNGRLKVALPVSSKTTIWLRGRGDLVRFDSAGSGAFDYTRGGGELGFTRNFGDFSMVSFSGFVIERFVPDNVGEEYQSLGLDLSFLGTLANGDVDLSTHYESRDYDDAGSQNDYRRFDLLLRDNRPFGSTFFTRGEFELELLWFDTTSYLTTNYRRGEASLLAGLNRSWGSIAAGPHIAILSETKADAYIVGEDYVEYGIKTQLDVIQPGRALASLESITGRRNLRDEGSSELTQTDFTFERLNLLLDWSLAGRISVNALVSTEWEWHKNSGENNRLVLFNTGLTYSL